MSKRTTITIETETLVVLRSRSAGWSWCAECATQVRTLRPADLPPVVLPRFASLNVPSAEASAATPGLHWIRGPDDAVLLCLNSLLAWIHTTNHGFPPSRITRKEDQ